MTQLNYKALLGSTTRTRRRSGPVVVTAGQQAQTWARAAPTTAEKLWGALSTPFSRAYYLVCLLELGGAHANIAQILANRVKDRDTELAREGLRVMNNEVGYCLNQLAGMMVDGETREVYLLLLRATWLRGGVGPGWLHALTKEEKVYVLNPEGDFLM